MKCSTEHSDIFKEGRGRPFLSVEVQNLHTLLVDVGLYDNQILVTRLDLSCMGVVLPDRLLSAAVLCV